MNIYKKIVAAFGVVGLSLLVASPALAAGAAVVFSSDTVINVAGGLSVTVAQGSQVTNYAVGTSVITFNVDTQSALTVRSNNLQITNSLNIANVCANNGTSSVTIPTQVGPATITFTPTNTPTCVSSGGGGGGGGGGSSIPAPTATFTASVSNIPTPGQTVNLTWSSANANSLNIDNGIGMVNLSGSVSVNPTQTTTYKLTASGTGGTVTQSVTVTVGAVTTPVTPTTPTTPTTPASSNGSTNLTSRFGLYHGTIYDKTTNMAFSSAAAFFAAAGVSSFTGLTFDTTFIPPQPVFSSWLKAGMTKGDGVLALQKYLNSKGFTIAAKGAGSAGHETNLLGSLTKNALKKWQKSAGLKVTGNIDAATIAYFVSLGL